MAAVEVISDQVYVCLCSDFDSMSDVVWMTAFCRYITKYKSSRWIQTEELLCCTEIAANKSFNYTEKWIVSRIFRALSFHILLSSFFILMTHSHFYVGFSCTVSLCTLFIPLLFPFTSSITSASLLWAFPLHLKPILGCCTCHYHIPSFCWPADT